MNLSDGPHTFEVRARDQSGKVDPTPAARSFRIDATPPGPASDFTAEARVGGAELSWVPSPFPDVITHRIYWDAGRGEIDYKTPSAAVPHPERTLSVALEQKGTYRFGLRAVDAAGNEEKNTTLVATVALTRPDAPTLDPVASPTTAASQTLSGRKDPGTSLWVNGREAVPLNAETAWSHTVQLAPGANRFEITCRSGSGDESPPRTVLIECDPLPLPVTTLRIHDPGTGTSVTLDWMGYDEASQGDIRQYHIYRSGEPFSTTEGLSPWATVPAGVFTHAVTGLPRGAPVWLAVAAVDARGGASPGIAPATVVPEDVQPPEAPSSLSVECFEDRLLFSWSPSADAAGDLSGYRMVFNGEPEPRVIPRDRTSFEVAGLAPATAYPVRLTAVDASGNESPSVSLQAVTLLQNPAGVTAEPQDGKVSLTWTDSSPRAYVARYLVYVSPSPFTSVRGMTPRTQAGSTSAAVSGLENGTTYYLAVTAVNTSGGERREVACVSATPRGDREGPSLSDVRFDGAPIGSGAVLRRSGTFSLTASDPSGVSRVELLIDGALRHADASGSGRPLHPWDILSVPDGPHIFTFRAADTFGNTSRLDLTLRVEMEPPGAPVIEAPAPGTLTREPSSRVSGRAASGSEVLLTVNGVQTGSPAPVSPQGVFQGVLPLGEGENRIQAAARNRGGTGPRSGAVTVTRDSTLPESPKNLSAELLSGGSVRLTWRAPAESGLRGCNLYRAGGPFETPSEAVRINNVPVSATTFENLPPGDGAYVFRATAVDRAGNESGLSNTASVVIDRTPPRATAVTFTPSGAFDPASGRMGPGLAAVRLTASEPLLATPYLSVTPEGGVPTAIDLAAAGDLDYTGVFTIAESTPTGTAHVVFSARDRAGNRGTEIDSGAALRIDTTGPSVSAIDLRPGQPIRNEEGSPAVVALEIGLTEAATSTPVLSYVLSAPGRTPVAVEPLEIMEPLPGEAERWRAVFTLPADAGLSEVETLQFLFEARDDLGNTGTRILSENRFQVYQGELPPLDSPRGLQGKPLPEGKVKLSWQAVSGAGDYEISRRGPGDSAPAVLARSGGTLDLVDAPPSEGPYGYTVSSVRKVHGDEAVSGPGHEVTVEADSTPPDPPRGLALELLGRGIFARWEPSQNEPVTYSLYRADAAEIHSVSGLTPILRGIGEAAALDPHPSASDHCYAVTAVDAAGNESPPSPSVYLNFGLLPVSALKVVQGGGGPPVLSWTPPTFLGVSGYRVRVAAGGETASLTTSLLTEATFTDTGFSGDERTYTVWAVDGSGVQGPARSITLPALHMALGAGEVLRRGVMNRLDFSVESRSASDLAGARLEVRAGGRSGLSEPFDLEGGGARTVSVPFGGFSNLPDSVELETILTLVPHVGERVEMSRPGRIAVEDGALGLGILNEEIKRGAAGAVRFVLENTGEEEIEILTATGSGSLSSPEITLSLRDADGNFLASTGYRQALGNGVVTLSNGSTVARIPAGETFTSEPVSLSAPLSAPERVFVQAVIRRVRFHSGKVGQIDIDGIEARREITLGDTAYAGAVTSVSPRASNGGEEIRIEGLARDSASGLPVSGVPLKVVIAVNGFERTRTVWTEGDGAFSHTFQPLPSESGAYTVFAVHPDVLDRPLQDGFVIRRVSVKPEALRLTLPRNLGKSFAIEVSTGEGTTVRNLRLALCEADQPGGRLPEGVHPTLGAPVEILESRRKTTLGFSLWADRTAPETARLVFRVQSDETEDGAWGRVTVHLAFSEAQPALWVTPTHIEAGVALGGAASEPLTLENRGLADLRDVGLTLLSADGSPAPAWVNLNAEAAPGDLAVGGKMSIGVSFTPGTDPALEGIHTFTLRVASANHPGRDIPLYATVTRSGVGNALFKVSDIYTGTVDPRGEIVQGLSGASITVQNELVPTVQKSLVTDALGEVLFTGLPAGSYRVRVTAPNHQEHTGRFWVKPGLTAAHAAFLPSSLVTVEWKVVETAIRDKYEIVLQATFEANVPAPVVVARPASVHLPKMRAGEVYLGELGLGNFGLVRAEDVRFEPPNGGGAFRYELLSDPPSTLEAKEEVSVPFRITCLQSFDSSEDGGASGGGCSRTVTHGRVSYAYTCANGARSTQASPYCVIHETGGCQNAPAPPGVSGGGSGGTWIYVHPTPGGPLPPAPAPAPQPISGLKCKPKVPRQEAWSDAAEPCPLETDQDVSIEVGSSVNTLLGEYEETVVDLSVKVQGGHVRVARSYRGGRWEFEDVRATLRFVPDSTGSNPRRIEKDGVEYHASGSGPSLAFRHGTYRIVPEGSGTVWKDRYGNWKAFDASGKMTAYGTPNGPVARLAYDAENRGRLSGVEDRHGRRVITYEYGSAGGVSAAVTLDGRRVEYAYTQGKLSAVRDVLGSTTTYGYDREGRLVRKEDPLLGRSETIAYDREGGVRSVLGPDGIGHVFDYDYDEGRQEHYARIKMESGLVKEVWYDREGDTRRVDLDGQTVRRIVKDGRHLVVTDESGSVTRREIDDRGNVTRVAHPDGTTVSFEVERTLNRPVKVVDERGTVTLHAYDGSGNMVEKIEAASTPSERIIRMSHDAYGNVTRVTGEGDERTSEAEAHMEYDSWGNLTAVVEPEGAVTRFTHDAMGNILTRTDPAGKVFSFTTDAAGRMTSAEDPLGNRTEISHDAAGNRVRVVDAEGKASAFEYDARDRLIKAVNPAGDETLFTYDAAGRIIRLTDPEGLARDYTYDSRGRLTAAIDGSGSVIRLEYADASGCPDCRGSFDEPSRIVTPTFTREIEYDVRGRKVREMDRASGMEPRSTRYVHDAGGSVTAVIAPDSQVTRFTHDALGRLSEVRDPLGGTVRYEYDDRDNLAALVDPNGHRLRFEYDRNNRLAREIRPLGQETTYLYDSRSRLVRKADPKNQVASYVYDDAGRLAELRTYGTGDHTNPVKSVSFTYDRVGNLKGYDDGVTSARYEYDDAYRKILEMVNMGSFELSAATAWYRNGTKKSYTGPGGLTTHYTYDAGNRLMGVEIPGKGFITVNERQWLLPARVTTPGGGSRELAYDPLMRLETLRGKDPAGALLIDRSFSRDALDRITAKRTEGGEVAYTYDELGRLTEVRGPGALTETFTHDAAGNRLRADASRGEWTYNANGELLGFDGATFSHDLNGNLEEAVSGGEAIRYVHNVEDQLERVETASGRVVAEYGYDPFGRRLWKEVGGRRTHYFHAEEGLVAEYDGTGKEIRSYGFKPGSLWTTDPLFMKEGSEVYFYHNDHLGTPVILTASSGRIVWSARYGAFGAAEVDPASLVENNLRFPGQYYDAETGLHYNFQRTYHPGLGRYLEPDPLGVGGSANPYGYPQDPVNVIDPLGLFEISWSHVAAGFGGALKSAAIATGVGLAAMAIAPAMVAAIPCGVVSAAFILTAGHIGWRTGQVITGNRIDFSLSDWRLHVRRMCDDKRSKMLGELLFDWSTLGLAALQGLKFCFEAGTPVPTESGFKAIEDLRPGDRVLSRDEMTGALVHREVVHLFATHDQPVYELTLTNERGESETLRTTADHPFHHGQWGWTRAVDLLPGDEVLSSHGGWLKVASGTWTQRRATVYNIEVQGTHSYFVGHLHAWVHNVCVRGGHNPHGKLGSPRHQAYVEDEVRSILKQYADDPSIIVRAEVRVVGHNGQVRYIDLQARNIKTNTIVDQVQIGRTNKNGTPVARERKNMEDIDRATGFNTRYRAYDY